MKEALIIIGEMSVCGTAAYLLYLLTVCSFGRHLNSSMRYAFLKAAALLFVLPVSKLLSPLLSITERLAAEADVDPVEPTYTVITSPQITTPGIPVQNIVPNAVPTTPVIPDVPAAAESAAGSIDIITMLAVIWITGAAAIFIWRIICRLRFEHDIRRVLIPAGEEVMSVYLRCCESMGVSRTVPVYICEKVCTPMIVGAVRPKIILPQKEISPKSLEFVFRHELTHYQRRDIFFKMFVSLVTMLHWFNPLVHTFNREFISILELSCDERAGRGLDRSGRKDYCMAILETVPVKRTSDVGLIFGTSGKKKLKQRLDNVMESKKMGLSQKIIAAVIAVVIAAASCVLVALFIPVDRTDRDDIPINVISDEKNIPDVSYFTETANDIKEDNNDVPDDTAANQTDGGQDQDITGEQTQSTTEQTQDNIDDPSLPVLSLNQIITKANHLLDSGGTGSIEGIEDPTVIVSFALPEEWVFNGSSVANVGDTKVFEIGRPYPTEEFSPEKVRYLGDDAVFPAVIENNAGHDVTIYEQKINDSGLYDYMDHGSVLLSTGDYETYYYVVSRNGWSIGVDFVVTEYFSEDIVPRVLSSVDIRQMVQLPAELDREITGLLDGFILTQNFIFTEPPSSGNETAEYNGREYYKIIDEKYDTWDKWSALFYSIYTPEFANGLLNNFNTVVNINGESYSDGGSRGNDTDSDYDYTVTFASDTMMIVEMTRGYHPVGDENSFLVDRLSMVRTDAGWRIESSNGWNAQTDWNTQTE